MSPAIVIGRMTWTELLRDRFVALFGFVAILLLFLSTFLGSLTLDEQTRLLVHLGFAGFQMTLVCLSIFLGAWTLQKELDRQTCLLILSRPVGRAQFVIGKWAGALALISLFWVLCGLFHLLLLGFDVDLVRYLIAHFSIWIEAVFVLSVAFFFASFLKPLLALASTFSLWLAGHWRQDLAFFAKKSKNGFFELMAQGSQWFFPPLDRLDVRTLQFLKEGSSSVVWWPLLNLFFWSALALFACQMIWRRRDLV